MIADLVTASLCLLLAVLTAWVLWQLGALGMRFGPVMAEAIRRRRHPPSAYPARAAALEATVRGLPLEQARSEAEKHLAESPYLVPEERGDDAASVEGLGPMLAEFFSRYRAVSTLGEEILAVERGTRVPGAANAICLGRYPEHGLFAAMPGSDEVLAFPNDVAPGTVDGRYPSIWHVVVWLHRDAVLLATS